MIKESFASTTKKKLSSGEKVLCEVCAYMEEDEKITKFNSSLMRKEIFLNGWSEDKLIGYIREKVFAGWHEDREWKIHLPAGLLEMEEEFKINKSYLHEKQFFFK